MFATSRHRLPSDLGASVVGYIPDPKAEEEAKKKAEDAHRATIIMAGTIMPIVHVGVDDDWN